MTMKRQLGVKSERVAGTTSMNHVLTVNSFQIQMIARCLTTSCRKSLHSFFDQIEKHVSSRSERLESKGMQTTWQNKNFNLSGDREIAQPFMGGGPGAPVRFLPLPHRKAEKSI